MKRALIRLVISSMVLAAGLALALGVSNWLSPTDHADWAVEWSAPVPAPDEESVRVTKAFQAAREDQDHIIRMYLEEGISPNLRSPRGDTLLSVAAYSDSLKVLETLLAHPETDLEAATRMGLTALSAAAVKGHVRCLEALLQAGAEVNASNSLGQTALMFASKGGKTSAVNLLLRAGADKTLADSQGKTAAHFARNQGARDILDTLGEKN